MEIKRLKDLCEGKGEYGIAAAAEPFSSKKYRYLRITDITDDGELQNEDSKSVSCLNCERYLLEKNDIVFARTGNSTGRAFFYEDKYGPLIYAGFLIKFHLDSKKVNPKYLKYFTISNTYKRWLSNGPTGSTRGNMSEEDFANMPIYLPPREDQNKLVDLFEIVDNMIDASKSMCISLESQAKLLNDYWFVQFDFPDENGRPYKSSGGKMIWDEELGQKIPDGWKSVPLSSVFEFEKGRIPNHIETAPTTECDTPYLTIDVVNAGAPSFCSSKNMILANGEVLMVMDGAASSDVYAGYNGAIGSTFAKCTIKNKSMSNQLLYVILRRYNNVFAKVNTGSTVPHANKDYILNFRIPLPNCAKLKDLSEKFVSILSLVYAAREENRELTSFRDFLLPMLMNGQVKIKDSESGAERNAET